MAGASAGEVPYLDEAAVMALLPAGAILDTRLDADINGDGFPDTAVMGGGERERRLVVVLAMRGGHAPPQSARLPAPATSGADISVDAGMLVVLDASGDDIETRTAYRYRFEPGSRRMRLMSIEAARYSGADQERVLKLDWDLVSGGQRLARGSIDASAADGDQYRYAAPVHGQHPTEPVYMEDTPDPNTLIDAAQRTLPVDRG